MKVISLIFIIIGFLSICCLGQQNDTVIYTNPEIKTNFKYDTCSSLIGSFEEYFKNEYKMPSLLQDNGYSGVILVELVIELDGTPSNVKVIRGIDDALDKSVKEKIKTMTNWIPGINNGKKVRSSIILPIPITWLYGKS